MDTSCRTGCKSQPDRNVFQRGGRGLGKAWKRAWIAQSENNGLTGQADNLSMLASMSSFSAMSLFLTSGQGRFFVECSLFLHHSVRPSAKRSQYGKSPDARIFGFGKPSGQMPGLQKLLSLVVFILTPVFASSSFPGRVLWRGTSLKNLGLHTFYPVRRKSNSFRESILEVRPLGHSCIPEGLMQKPALWSCVD